MEFFFVHLFGNDLRPFCLLLVYPQCSTAVLKPKGPAEPHTCEMFSPRVNSHTAWIVCNSQSQHPVYTAHQTRLQGNAASCIINSCPAVRLQQECVLALCSLSVPPVGTILARLTLDLPRPPGPVRVSAPIRRRNDAELFTDV